MDGYGLGIIMMDGYGSMSRNYHVLRDDSEQSNCWFEDCKGYTFQIMTSASDNKADITKENELLKKFSKLLLEKMYDNKE